MSAQISISGEAQRRTRTRRWFPQEYKDQVLAWYFDSGKPVALAAEELGLSESTLRDWIRRATRVKTASSAAVPEETLVVEGEVDEIAWHGEPEEPYETALPHQAEATWVYSPGRLEALLAGTPPIAELAYKLGVSESSVKAWVRTAASELEADTTACDDDSPSSVLARDFEVEATLDVEPVVVEAGTGTGEVEPEATVVLEPDAILELEPVTVAMGEATIQADEPTVQADAGTGDVDEVTVTVTTEASDVTVQADDVVGEPEAATESAAEESLPLAVGENDDRWTLVWRPPAFTDGNAASEGAYGEWVYTSGWTMGQARSAALALLGNCEAEIEVEFLQVPRHRLGGRVNVRARRRTATA